MKALPTADKGMRWGLLLLIASFWANGCASLNYYSGADTDKEMVRQVLLVHAQSVIAGHTPVHLATHTTGAISAGPFTGDKTDQLRTMTEAHFNTPQSTINTNPPEREVVGKIRISRVNIKFLKDKVAFTTYREIGFDSMDRKVFEHDVAAFLSKEGRDWKIYAMAAGDIQFDREGLEQYWYLNPENRPKINRP